VIFAVQHGKIQKSQQVLATPLRRGTGISSPVGVYADSTPTANSHTSPSGEVLAMMDAVFTPEFQAKFWARVSKDSSPNCWIWAGSIDSSDNTGYGVFSFKGRNYKAHRVSFVLSGGTIPDGMVIDHLCRNRACVNPAHLECVTHRENILRGEGVSAQHAKKSHCSKGHLLAGDNLSFRKNGGRRCLACHRESRARSESTPQGKEKKRLRKAQAAKESAQ